jgi:alkylation response protein AidB-like acyl-CoA dehydrogenase
MFCVVCAFSVPCAFFYCLLIFVLQFASAATGLAQRALDLATQYSL